MQMHSVIKGAIFVVLGVVLYVVGNGWAGRNSGQLGKLGMIFFTILSLIVVGVGLFLMVSVFV